jgi:ubiquinone biosynthesis accessory factor UbiK
MRRCTNMGAAGSRTRNFRARAMQEPNMEKMQLDELARHFIAGLPSAVAGMRAELEANFRAALQGAAGRFDLTSRSEFEVQAKVLERARARIAELEARMTQLEERLNRL